MNRPSICWKCVNREGCKVFNKNPEAKVTYCGRFLMKKEDEAIMQALEDLNKELDEVNEQLDYESFGRKGGMWNGIK